MVDTDPSESNGFHSLLKFRVNTDSLPMLKVYKRTPNLSTIVVFPKILAQTFQSKLNALDSRSNRKYDNFSLTCIFVNSQYYLLAIFYILKHCHFFIF